MSEKEKEDEKEKPATVGLLRELIRDELGSVVDKLGQLGGGSDKKEDDKKDEKPSGDMTSQVQSALAALKVREQRVQRDKDVDELLAERKKTPEKETAPVERGRLHKFMGWGD